MPYQQVRQTVYDWLLAEIAKSPPPELSRVQLFQIEQRYFVELRQQRYRLGEIPLAQPIGGLSQGQVFRASCTLDISSARLIRCNKRGRFPVTALYG